MKSAIPIYRLLLCCMAILLFHAPTVPAATSDTATVAGTTTGSATVVADYDVSMFFPEQQRPANAASAYILAFRLLNADRRPEVDDLEWADMLERPLVRRALDEITSGARCASCDLIPHLPDDLSRATKFPYLFETQAFAKLLSARCDVELERNDREAAMETARTLAAFGRHLRQSALVLSQEVQGIVLQRLAVNQFQKILANDADGATSAKLTTLRQLLDWSQGLIADQVTSHSAMGDGLSADREWLQSPYPVFRCEAIINIAEATFPGDVLRKPEPPITLRTVMEEMALTSTSTIKLRKDAFPDYRIKWPRKGVRSTVRREDVQMLRELLKPVAQNDPAPRVRVLAQRVLDSLIEPKPTPAARSDDRTTTPGLRRIPPPPRPPGSRRPPGFPPPRATPR